MPNLTFYRTADWPMLDSADPCHGWSCPDVLQTYAGPASNDLYGRLYAHVKKNLANFHRRISNHDIHLQLHHRNAIHLPQVLNAGSFARIETSNISKNSYLGVERVVTRLIPLLQSSAIKPCATLITSFMNAVKEVQGPESVLSLQREAPLVARYLPLRSRVTGDPPNAVAISMMCGQDLVRDMDHYFDR